METKKLTCRDLMIRDWVYRSDCYDKVVEVRKDTILGSDPFRGLIPIADLQPITLTAEILEKNGWYIPINSSWWHNDVIDFYLVGYTDGSFQIYTDKDSEFSNLCRINHVHELQHLYRICRIRKEIVL